MTDAVIVRAQRAAGLGDEVGGHQRPGHHRHADGIPGGTNRQRHADRADEEDHALSGQVTDSKGNPVLDATVVVFPANEKLWTYQSRFIKAARPDQDGRYRVTALPAGKYLVVALQGLEDGQAGDPEFLATIKDLATRLDLGRGRNEGGRR